MGRGFHALVCDRRETKGGPLFERAAFSFPIDRRACFEALFEQVGGLALTFDVPALGHVVNETAQVPGFDIVGSKRGALRPPERDINIDSATT